MGNSEGTSCVMDSVTDRATQTEREIDRRTYGGIEREAGSIADRGRYIWKDSVKYCET